MDEYVLKVPRLLTDVSRFPPLHLPTHKAVSTRHLRNK